eukprot:8233770-Pyramimonas_sp.AAC.1
MRSKKALDDNLDDFWDESDNMFGSKGVTAKRAAAPSEGEEKERPSSKKPKGGEGKRQHELDTSEQVILKATQWIASLGQDDMALAVTVKKHTAVRDALNGRLKQSCLDLYAADLQEASSVDGNGRGMAILEKLRSAQAQVEACSGWAREISAAKMDVPEYFKQACVAQGAGVTIAFACTEKAWKQICADFFEAEKFDEWAQALVDGANMIPAAFRG